MTWFIGRSIVVIVLAFVLGLLVGWLWWRRRKVQFSESQALAVTVARKNAEIQARDDEIARLSAVEATATSVVGDDAAAGGSDVPAPTGQAPDYAPDDAPDAGPRAGAVEAAPARTDPTAGMVLAPTDPAPEQYASHATPVADIPTGGISVQEILDAQAARPAVAPGAVPGAGPGTRDAADTAGTPGPHEAGAAAAPPEDGDSRGAPADHEIPDSGATPSTGALPRVVDVTAAEEAGPARVVDVTDGEEDEDDDLERVEGIGPRIGAALRNAGIHTFRELADADTATLQGALEQAGLRFAPTLPTWSRQARFLADGDEAGFQALTQQLAGGRNVSRTK